MLVFCPACVKAHRACMSPVGVGRKAACSFWWGSSISRFPEEGETQEMEWPLTLHVAEEPFLDLRIWAVRQANSIGPLFPSGAASGSIWCGRSQLAAVSTRYEQGTSWQQRCIFFPAYLNQLCTSCLPERFILALWRRELLLSINMWSFPDLLSSFPRGSASHRPTIWHWISISLPLKSILNANYEVLISVPSHSWSFH